MQDAMVLADAWDSQWDLLRVIRIGADFYINCGFYFDRAGVGRLKVVDADPALVAQAGDDWPDLLLDGTDL